MQIKTTKSMLYFGFAMLVALMVILTSIGLTIHKQNIQRLDTIVNSNNLKRDLILQMRTAARERTGNLTKMSIIEDYLELDEQWMSFNNNGSSFMAGYEAMKKMPMNHEELALFKAEEKAMQLIGPIQRQVAALIFENKINEARVLLLTRAIPEQHRAYRGLTDMMDIQQKNAKQSVEQAKQDFYATQVSMIILAACIIFTSLLIAYFITRRVTDTEQKLKHAHDDLEHRVVERTRELSIATEKANNANRAKSEFLSRMSHELRTPLNAILGFSELMVYNPKDPVTEKQEEMLSEINMAGKHLLELINEVLDLATIEAGKIKLKINELALSHMLSKCKTLIQPLAGQQNIKIIDETNTEGEQMIFADQIRLKQILINLMSNAVKYNIKNGSITLQCEQRDNNMLCIKVIDTGPGIPLDQQSLLFQPFERLPATKGKTEGTGIGLVVTKQLVELMGGEIGVESAPGKGSTFWFTVKQTKAS